MSIRWLVGAILALIAGCDGAAAVDGGAPDAARDATVDGALDSGPDAGAPDPDAGWPEGLDLIELFDAYESGELGIGAVRAALRDAPPGVAVDRLGARLDRPVLVPAGASLAVSEALTITADGLLALAPGARLTLAAGVRITGDGRLYAIGAADAPVVIDGDGYDTVALDGGPNALHHARLSGGDRLLTVSHGAGVRTRIVAAELDHWVDVALDLPGADGVELRDSRVGLASAPDEGGEMVRTRGGGAIRIEGNTFGPRRGYRDVIDLQDCVGRWPVIIGNAFAEGEDDAIDLDRCSAFVVGNHIRDFRPLDLEARRAGINGGGITGDGDIDIVIVGNVIERCYHGIGFKNGARPVMLNNTIVDGHIGVTLYQSAVGQPAPHGVMINNLLVGNRDWLTDAPRDVVLDGRWWPTYNQRDPVQGTLDADHNTFASGGDLPPGAGNDARDPALERPDGWPLPGAGSPALDSGRGGLLPVDAIEWLRVDLLGHARAWDGQGFVDIDRGAIER